jgi:multisubunit Na+/H+ antiporter MnhC subunit
MVEAEQMNTKTARAANFAIQGATTVLCTMLISLYLIYKARQYRKLIGMETGQSISNPITNAIVWPGQVQLHHIIYTGILSPCSSSLMLWNLHGC